MKILIIHGWMHSSKIYSRLKHDLEKNGKHDVFLYELAGFGNRPAKYKTNIIRSYSNELEQFLLQNKTDLIIAHSLGGRVSLEATENISVHRILLSPEYKGIKLLKFIMPLTSIGVWILKLLKNKNIITTFILKLFSLFTINSWSAITDDVIDSARQADQEVAIELIKEMCNDRYITKESKLMTYLIIGEKDRIISKYKILDLKNDLVKSKLIEIKRIGHTAVLEDYDSLYANIKSICEDISNEC